MRPGAHLSIARTRLVHRPRLVVNGVVVSCLPKIQASDAWSSYVAGDRDKAMGMDFVAQAARDSGNR